VIRDVGPYPFDAPFLYTLPAALFVLPLARLAPVTGLVIFVAIAGAALGFALTRDGYHRLPALLSAAYLWSASTGQWSPFVTAAALVPSLGWVLVAKPTIGLAAIAYRPSRRAIALCGIVVIVSLFIQPRWPVEWLAAASTRRRGDYFIPLTTLAGPILLLAVTRWRRPEARLLLVMASIPQTYNYYDQLPLWLVPATLGQSAGLSLLSYAILAADTTLAVPYASTSAGYGAVKASLFVAMLYLPALALVLRRPNSPPMRVTHSP
jgi:hypothetical protein